MNVKLLIDNRESIKNDIKVENIKYDNLTIGDYIFTVNDEICIIIERKTIEDYAASIIDGRNREQKKRLLEYPNKTSIIYLIEGSLVNNNCNFKYNKISNNTIVSSIINTIIRDGIQVFHTSSKNETIFFLESIYNKLEKQGNTFIDKKTSYTEDFINASKVSKKDLMDDNVAFQMMLNCIPKVSNKLSKRIATKYKNISEFIFKLKDIENKLEFLQNLKYCDTKNRKIPKNTCQNIIDFLGI